MHHWVIYSFYSIICFLGRVAEADSLFTYREGESWKTFVDNEFIPVFFDPDLTMFFKDETLRNEAIITCNPEGNGNDLNPIERRPCYYDFKMLADSIQAKATGDLNTDVKNMQTTLGLFSLFQKIMEIKNLQYQYQNNFRK